MKKEKIIIIILSVICILLLVVILFNKNDLKKEDVKIDSYKNIIDPVNRTSGKSFKIMGFEDNYKASDGKEYTRINLNVINNTDVDTVMNNYLLELTDSNKKEIGQCYSKTYGEYINFENIFPGEIKSKSDNTGYIYCSPSSENGTFLKISYVTGGSYFVDGTLDINEQIVYYKFR